MLLPSGRLLKVEDKFPDHVDSEVSQRVGMVVLPQKVTEVLQHAGIAFHGSGGFPLRAVVGLEMLGQLLQGEVILFQLVPPSVLGSRHHVKPLSLRWSKRRDHPVIIW